MKENWANNLKEQLNGYEQPVNERLWEGIARSTAATKVHWWPWLLASMASAAAAITFVLLLHHPEPVVHEPLTTISDNTLTVIEEEPVYVVPTEAPRQSPLDRTPTRLAENKTTRPQIESSIQEDSTIEEKTGEEAVAIPETMVQIQITPLVESDPADESAESGWTEMIPEEPLVHRRCAKFSTSFYSQASPFGNRFIYGQPVDDRDGEQTDQPTTPPSGQDSGSSTWRPGGGGSDPGPGSVGENVIPPDDSDDGDDEDTKSMNRAIKRATSEPAPAFPEWTHSFPVQIGARVSLSWNDRWSVETGLTYMHFFSKYAGRQQRMEYLGVPAYVSYRLKDTCSYSFYATAGGQAYKCWAGNAPDKPWLFSCGIGAGAEYHLSTLASLYVEPGADWYFHTGESRNYYTDNPFAFSLSLGMRLHF